MVGELVSNASCRQQGRAAVRLFLFCMYRLYAEELHNSKPEGSVAPSLLLENGTPNTPKTCESEFSALEVADSSIEHRRSSVSSSLSGIRSSCAVMSAERPQHSGISRPGRDGIKLNSDPSRMVSLLKRSDSSSSESRPDVQGLSTAHSYVDKFSEFLSHGKFMLMHYFEVSFCKFKPQKLLFYLHPECRNNNVDSVAD